MAKKDSEHILPCGITIAYSALDRHGCLKVVENDYCASKRGGVCCLSILNAVFAIIFGVLSSFLGSGLLTLGSSCTLPLFWRYEIAVWGLVILYGGTAILLRRKAAVILDEGEFGSRTLCLEMPESNPSEVTSDVGEVPLLCCNFGVWELELKVPRSTDSSKAVELRISCNNGTNYDYEETLGTYDEASRQDLGYDPNFVPDSVKSFVVHLYRYIREKNVYEIHQMNEISFQTLSDRLFKDTPWPSVDAVAHYVDNDQVFCLLYREMWFRHLYARLSPTLKQRIDSWDNYCSLFQIITFNLHLAKMKNKTEQEIALLRQFDQAWNVYGVLNYLQAFVEKSNIIQILEQEKEGGEQFTATDGYDYSGGSNVLKVLGYFSMVGLLRVHCLLGDYQTGLKCLLPIDISQQGVYTSVIGSHIATIYHYGFANLMMRRYVFVSLVNGVNAKLVEETVNSQLREKYAEKMARMQRYDDEAFAIYDELFSYACPKFITPSAPSFEEPLVNYNQDAYRLQLKLFLYEVKQQQLLSGVRTFLKVYSTISLGKLANYMEVDEPTLRSILFTYKHKTHAVDSDGKIISNADDTIHVVESKPVKRYGDYFLRHIVKE
ncbi:RNA polymerase I-associated factor PAF67 isoform 2 [Hibiscus syriacus]|uniref:RNA polymerase I-associated factor PAF67 isoform 2 n=1 Tax=Hibiscus syriacus TaxID=106335 RepID=A0A6A3A7R8_HIBSY|nr:RNA polymerase I-associated factor PAF67 isoform 2 [Hibiscus syriacus]